MVTNILDTLYQAIIKPGAKSSSITKAQTQIRETNFAGLDDAQQKLLLEAERIKANAYNPYSQMSIGAAVLGELNAESIIVGGTNHDNASYGISTAAEISALVTANNLGINNIRAIAVIAEGKGFDPENPATIPGDVRQVIKEYADRYGTDIELILSNLNKDKIHVTTISKLLPYAFGLSDFKTIDVAKYQKAATVEKYLYDLHAVRA